MSRFAEFFVPCDSSLMFFSLSLFNMYEVSVISNVLNICVG